MKISKITNSFVSRELLLAAGYLLWTWILQFYSQVVPHTYYANAAAV